MTPRGGGGTNYSINLNKVHSNSGLFLFRGNGQHAFDINAPWFVSYWVKKETFITTTTEIPYAIFAIVSNKKTTSTSGAHIYLNYSSANYNPEQSIAVTVSEYANKVVPISDNAEACISGVQPIEGEWTHVLLSFDYPYLKIFINGTCVHTVDYTTVFIGDTYETIRSAHDNRNLSTGWGNYFQFGYNGLYSSDPSPNLGLYTDIVFNSNQSYANGITKDGMSLIDGVPDRPLNQWLSLHPLIVPTYTYTEDFIYKYKNAPKENS